MSKIIAMAALLSLLPTAAPAAPIMTVPPGHSKSQARAPKSKVPLVLGLRANGGTMTSFNDAVGLDLADADYGKFVDPRVQGADRARALKFLRLMPKNMRGDFVYIDNSGRILSNRP
ncbi:MAG TPA: hypothetical protein VK665_11215, partial [Candidatus Elarobacter sp.]|nr:hypothetical protein [Candidatus Elarobacter sp.]